ncbi:hypothetical protein [uncultured Tateyamaria sp.]|uniref:hypothetical protein n=1 Tax=Tateyamaria sp. 1078 TaxID=3417464 RepID=UPI00260F429B|nr:hypothetical protein [uncultured Tateyamaria sp.]
MRTKLTWTVIAALVMVAACDAPAPEVDGLRGPALEARLTNQRITLSAPNTSRKVTIDLRAGGVGTATLAQRQSIFWTVEEDRLCVGRTQSNLDCARTAIAGNRITVRFARGNAGGSEELSGTLSPL